MTIRGVKGFDKDFKCRGYQFEVGKTYEEKDAKICKTGFHFCENPLDVFKYYSPADSRYAEVEGSGKIDRETGGDSKVAVKKLKIKSELSLNEVIELGVDFIFDRVDWENREKSNTGFQSAATNTGNHSVATNTGDWSTAINTGEQSVATNTGYRSVATNTGDWSTAISTGNQSVATNTGDWSTAINTGDWSTAINTGDRSTAINTGDRSVALVEGKESVAMALGFESKAKGSLGCWLVLAEWDEDSNYDHIIDVKLVKVDGERIKADTYYQLVAGEFVEVNSEEAVS